MDKKDNKGLYDNANKEDIKDSKNNNLKTTIWTTIDNIGQQKMRMAIRTLRTIMLARTIRTTRIVKTRTVRKKRLARTRKTMRAFRTTLIRKTSRTVKITS